MIDWKTPGWLWPAAALVWVLAIGFGLADAALAWQLPRPDERVFRVRRSQVISITPDHRGLMMRCPACRSTGRDLMRPDRPCSSCQGRGWLYHHFEDREVVIEPD